MTSLVIPRAQLQKHLAPAVRFPTIEGNHVTLRPIAGRDLKPLYDFETRGVYASQWRLRGSVPTFEEWKASTLPGPFVQFLVDTPDGETMGHVLAYGAKHGSCAMACTRFRELDGSLGDALLMPAAIGLFIQELFQEPSFHKIYMEVPEFNVGQITAGIDRYLEEEAHLKRHVFHEGRWWDEFTYALYRERWFEPANQRLVARA